MASAPAGVVIRVIGALGFCLIGTHQLAHSSLKALRAFLIGGGAIVIVVGVDIVVGVVCLGIAAFDIAADAAGHS